VGGESDCRCHPERSEGDHIGHGFLRFAQDDIGFAQDDLGVAQDTHWASRRGAELLLDRLRLLEMVFDEGPRLFDQGLELRVIR
jgi:hypothetical protein